MGCIAGPLFYLLSEVTMVGIGISRRSSFALIASFIAFVVSIVINYFLVHYFGAIGASIAIMISFYIFFIIKTESTIYLWHNLNRTWIYIMFFLYILNTIFIQIVKPNSYIYSLTWILLFFVSSSPYYKKILIIIKYRRI